MKNLLTTIFCLLIAAISMAQVGINTESPSQMLDVEGRIEIGDDTTPPTDGAIRYNAADEDFEGYTGTEWNSFTSREIGFPSNPIPVYGYAAAIVANSQADVRLHNYDTSFNYIGPQIPAGKFLLVTHILFQTNSLTVNDDYVCQVTVGARAIGQSNSFYRRRLRFFVKWSNNHLYSGDLMPLIIVRPGEFLTVRNGQTSQTPIDAKIRGFLVDDLNFN